MAGVAVFWLIVALSLALPAGVQPGKNKPSTGSSRPAAGSSRPAAGSRPPSPGSRPPSPGSRPPSPGSSGVGTGSTVSTSTQQFDRTQLHNSMVKIWNIYDPYNNMGQYSMAIIVPFVNGQPDLDTVQRADPPTNIANSFRQEEVYSGHYIVAAKPVDRKNVDPNLGIKDHAEYRVLKEMQRINSGRYRTFKKKQLDQNADYRLILYTYFSPCLSPCADEGRGNNILQYLPLITAWGRYALVFTEPFQPGKGTEKEKQLYTPSQLKTAIMNIAQGNGFGLDHIFRCDNPECVSCKDQIDEGKTRDKTVRKEVIDEEGDTWTSVGKEKIPAKPKIQVHDRCVQGTLG
ncbi:uncharacterized protein LOC115367529 [Myripristis murdjan]|uniref:uncharacterized protein LOC115367529 n=1 Tax=Myripristis murdjan TaxID=586833 RepID=UPI00117606D9|nr:uncharacterized protein LOC115367529 [Myripristis murdjan]